MDVAKGHSGMRRRCTLAVALLSTVLATGVRAQATTGADVAAADTTVAASRANTVYLPVLGYTPDTSLMLGVALLRFFYLDPPGSGTRPSVFSPTFIYTTRNQVMIFMGTDLNWGGGRNHAGVFPSYVKFPDSFYGIGREVSLDDEEDYTPEQIKVDLAFDRRLWSELRLGATYTLLRHRLVKVESGGQLASGQVRGVEKSTVSAPGLSLAWDTRDHTWDPRRGLWLQVNGRWARGGLGSDDDFNEYTADLRGYLPVGRTTVLAGQILGARLEGDIPFFMLPKLGGEYGLRGYRGGLYRDGVRLLGRAEIRRDGIWKRLGGVVFAGIGDVAPSPGKLTLAGNLWTAGIGLRYLLAAAEKVKVRLDYGWGNGDSGFYLSLGEAF